MMEPGSSSSNLTVRVGSEPVSVTAANLTADGGVDLITANQRAASLNVVTSNGRGTIELNTTAYVDASPYHVIAADLNRSGTPQLITTDFDAGTVMVLTQTNSRIARVWSQTMAPAAPSGWSSAVSSADGSHILVAGVASGLYASTDSGANWSTAAAPTGPACYLACSADGTKVVVASQAVFTSTNAGATWTASTLTNSSSTAWTAVASSADGLSLFAAAPGVGVFASRDAGMTWTQTAAPSSPGYTGLCCSANGTRLYASADSACFYVSTDSGTTSGRPSVPGGKDHVFIACSADGNRVVAGVGEAVYISTGWATHFVPPPCPTGYGDAPPALPTGVTWSSHPAKLLDSTIYTSTDFGNTWLLNVAPDEGWNCVVSSADGAKLVALAGWNGGLAGAELIYTCQTCPVPLLHATPASGGLLLSWTFPSISFDLAQTSDLEMPSWMHVPSTPQLNLSNVQYEVTVATSTNRALYQLVSQ